MSLSPLLWHYEAVWRLLAFRTDIDDLIVELLGRLSLERIYADSDRRAYSQLVLTLLVQLNSVFSLQRLYLPKDKQPSTRSLSYLVSWEVTIRTVEAVVQLVVDGKESLWEIHGTICNALGRFLLSALRVLALHPKPTGIFDFTHRDRVARLHTLLELVCDNYPDSSDLLLVCREVTRSLSDNPYSLTPPTWLRCQLASLKTKLYPLPDCLSPHYASTIVPPDDSSSGWLSQFLALHDMAQFVIGAMIQHAVDEGSIDENLQQAAIRSRNAILQTAKRIRLPDNLAGTQLLPILEESFGVVLSDSNPDHPETTAYELHEQSITIESLNAFCKRLIDRQMSQRSSDREVTQNILAITRHLSRLAKPSSRKPAETTPRLYVINCHQSHLIGSFQVKQLLHISFEGDGEDSLEISLPQGTTCPLCYERVTMLREITLARHVWELLHPLETDDGTVDTERHLPTQFRLSPAKPEADTSHHHRNKSLNSLKREQLQQHAHFAHTWDFSMTPGSSISTGERSVLSHGDFDHQSLSESSRRSSSVPSIGPLPSSPIKEASASDADRSKLPWRRRLTLPKRNSTQSSSDASSISTGEVESEKLEEISLQRLKDTFKTSGKGKTNKNIYVSLSQNSTDAVFWTQSSVEVWDVGTTPATFIQSFTADGSYIVAAVSKTHLAYIFLSRDRALILHIRNFRNPSDPIVEYRMEHEPWCKNIAISPSGHAVVVGFENSTIRFFDTTGMVPPREDRVHCREYQICNGCPSIETVSFSNDGLNVLASTRNHTGIIQVYRWEYPFQEYEELQSCRYHVPMHESEDNGVTAVLYQPTAGGEGTVCITTWTQSGTPVLVQTKDGFRSEIKGQGQGSHGQWKVGSRIQNAVVSPSGREFALMNDNGFVFRVSNPNAAVLDARKIVASTKLSTRSESFSMSFVSIPNEGDIIALAWADASKGIGFVKTIRTPSSETQFVNQLTPPLLATPITKARNSANYFSESFANVTLLRPPVELPAEENLRDDP